MKDKISYPGSPDKLGSSTRLVGELKLSRYRVFRNFSSIHEDAHNEKPHPEPYLKALKKSGCKASECLVIEESERGLAAAKAAGIKCIVIPNGFTSQGDFSGAYRILDNIQQVVDEVIG